MRNTTAPFHSAESSRIIGREPRLSDGTCRVLATLECGEKTYRVVAELLVRDDVAQLRVHRFDLPDREEWFAERKLMLPVSRPELVRLEAPVKEVEFALAAPVRLDEHTMAVLFGPSGPPAT
jgi:hypothetical protein